jgi:hypothetical protein
MRMKWLLIRQTSRAYKVIAISGSREAKMDTAIEMQKKRDEVQAMQSKFCLEFDNLQVVDHHSLAWFCSSYSFYV